MNRSSRRGLFALQIAATTSCYFVASGVARAAPVAPIVGFALAEQPPEGTTRRLTIILQMGDTGTGGASSLYTFDPTRASVTFRRVGATGAPLHLRALADAPMSRATFGAVAVTAGATYRVDVALRTGSLRLKARNAALPKYAPAAIIYVPAVVAAAKDPEITRVKAAFASVPLVPNMGQPVTRTLVLRPFGVMCETIRGEATGGEAAGDTVLFSGVSRATANDGQPVFPPYNSAQTPVMLSTAPLFVTMFGDCDNASHAFASADDLLDSLKPIEPASPPPTTSPGPSSSAP